METREQREGDWGHHSAILETKEKILSSHEVYLKPERRPFNKVSFCCMCAEEIFKRSLHLLPPNFWLNIPCHPGYQGFVSMKEAMISQGLYCDIITESLGRQTKRDGLLFGIQISLLMRRLGREKKEDTPNKINAADGGPDSAQGSWIFYRILGPNRLFSLSFSVMIDDKAWGKNKPTSSVVSGWFNRKQHC